MTARSTRNKVRFQGRSSSEDLRRAQEHLTELAALAGECGGFIDEHLPVIMVALESVRLTLDKFNEGL
jgi:hypothetical protein